MKFEEAGEPEGFFKAVGTHNRLMRRFREIGLSPDRAEGAAFFVMTGHAVMVFQEQGKLKVLIAIDNPNKEKEEDE